LVEIRGLQREAQAVIRMGDLSRIRLGVKEHERYSFCIREVSWLGQFLWAWNAADSAARIAARLGLLGLALGIIGVILGVLALRN
jgi:hypothetical protein